MLKVIFFTIVLFDYRAKPTFVIKVINIIAKKHCFLHPRYQHIGAERHSQRHTCYLAGLWLLVPQNCEKISRKADFILKLLLNSVSLQPASCVAVSLSGHFLFYFILNHGLFPVCTVCKTVLQAVHVNNLGHFGYPVQIVYTLFSQWDNTFSSPGWQVSTLCFICNN